MSERNILDGDLNADVRLVPLRTGGVVDGKVSCPYCGKTNLTVHPQYVTLLCGSCLAEFRCPGPKETLAGCGEMG